MSSWKNGKQWGMSYSEHCDPSARVDISLSQDLRRRMEQRIPAIVPATGCVTVSHARCEAALAGSGRGRVRSFHSRIPRF